MIKKYVFGSLHFVYESNTKILLYGMYFYIKLIYNTRWLFKH